MIPYDIDPSLHTAEPEPQRLGDGFSPPRHDEPVEVPAHPAADAAPAPLGDKSAF